MARIKSVLLDMYDISEDEFQIIPSEVIDAINNVQILCERAGGELVSRQIIAEIVARVDTRKVYTKGLSCL